MVPKVFHIMKGNPQDPWEGGLELFHLWKIVMADDIISLMQLKLKQQDFSHYLFKSIYWFAFLPIIVLHDKILHFLVFAEKHNGGSRLDAAALHWTWQRGIIGWGFSRGVCLSCLTCKASLCLLSLDQSENKAQLNVWYECVMEVRTSRYFGKDIFHYLKEHHF